MVKTFIPNGGLRQPHISCLFGAREKLAATCKGEHEQLKQPILCASGMRGRECSISQVEYA